jgi:ParB family transcriptional regulator, chromosome partitioning protein
MCAVKKNDIGKGISALLGNISSEIGSFKPEQNTGIGTLKASTNTLATANAGLQIGDISKVNIDSVVTNPKQPRRVFTEQALSELSDSIKLHGIIQPITVIRLEGGDKPRYQLISGERRWRASKLAGLSEIPAYLRSADNQAQIELALLENLQREDLNAIEIAMSYKLLMDECKLTQEEVAERMKKERSTVTNYLRLLKLPPTIQQSVVSGALSMGHARTILSVEHIDQQLFLSKEIIAKQLSVRQTEVLAKQLSASKSKSSSTSTATLAPAYKRIQDDIASKLSTKVVLDRKSNGKGSITIEFYGDSDLERLMEVIGL